MNVSTARKKVLGPASTRVRKTASSPAHRSVRVKAAPPAVAAIPPAVAAIVPPKPHVRRANAPQILPSARRRREQSARRNMMPNEMPLHPPNASTPPPAMNESNEEVVELDGPTNVEPTLADLQEEMTPPPA